MVKFIVAIETVKIKEFLFSTNKLRVIRGASYLLDYLNQVEVPKILEEAGIEEKDIIYIGAGNAKFFTDTKEKADEIINKVKKTYENEAPGVKIAAVYREKTSSEKVWDSLEELSKLTAIEKSKGFSTLNIDLPYVEKCELSGNEVAEIDYNNLKEDLIKLDYKLEGSKILLSDYNKSKDDKIDKVEIETLKDHIKKLAKITGRISEGTLKKIIASDLLKKSNRNIYNNKKIGFYKYLLENYNLEIRSSIDNFENEDSFIGFVYSDGDGLGDFFKNIKEVFIEADKQKVENVEKKYLNFLKDFSEILDEVTKESLAKTLNKIFEGTDLKDKKRWGEFLIVGGDDVCAVFDPTLAIKISVETQKKFEDTMVNKMSELSKKFEDRCIKDRIGKVKITSSSGVIIAKTKTPMFQLFEQGLKLQKSAKKKRNETRKNGELAITGFIDFQVIGSEGCVNIDEFRKEISPDNNKVIERPYSIKNIDDNVKTIDSLLKTINDFKKYNFPSNKLRYIYDLKRGKNLEEFEKKMNFINILSKMDKEHIDLIKEIGIDYKNYDRFNENFKNIFDILEIYKFVDNKVEVKGGDK
ncbi:hypothetical protein KST26_03035 [Fusobacterium animalis]|uniref:Cas10/Cmr2 second palm domain-containing protein n=1 Tax=Fusobacterium animalis TaxID=76859 RepID=UPI0030D20C7C